MKVSEITPELLEAWKQKCLTELDIDGVDQTNLISLCLRSIRDDPTPENLTRQNKSLLEYYKVELARNGELQCNDCGRSMEVYYEAQCFYCNKPQPKPVTRQENNLIKAMKWMSRTVPEFDYDSMWSSLVSECVIESNDSFCQLHVPTASSDPEYKLQVDKFMKHFEIVDVYWWVSW